MNRSIPVFAMLVLVTAVGSWWIGRIGSSAAGAAAAHADASAPRRALYWYDPMRPDQHFDKPGQSPFMDMQLVPRYPSEGDDATVVSIDPRMAQNLGIRTARVTAASVSLPIVATGSVTVNEHAIVAVESRAAGWVEKLDVRAVGDTVSRGQRLAGIYSPDLLAAQEELGLARKLGETAMVDAARTRLNLLGITESATGAQRRVEILAPQAGVVTELAVREGMQITPGTPLMRLADLSTVWIVVEIPESEAGLVVAGEQAQARLAAVPGRRFDGTVDYVYPVLDASTRTLRARLAFDNRDTALRPGMYAEVTLPGQPGHSTTLVPTDAVIRTGHRNTVLVTEGAGRFRPVAVTIGAEANGQIVITSGLTPGQQVVTSGQFLIDSEARLQGAYQRMQTPLPAGAETPGTAP